MQKVRIPISIEDALRLSKIKKENPKIQISFLLDEGIKHLFGRASRISLKRASKV